MAIQNNFEAVDELLKNQKMRIRKWRSLVCCATAFVLLLGTVYLLVGVIFQINIIHGDSMNDTLKSGTLAVSQRHFETLSPGDIVILWNTDENDYIKRVVAVPGDTVDIDEENGTLMINGKAADEPYALGKTKKTNKTVTFPMTLGENEYFIVGDNREHSCDSRYFGAVTIDRIGGVVILPNTNG